MFRADHLGNAKTGGVSIYFKESLPERCLHNPDLKEFLIFQVSMSDKRSYVVSLYRAPSQTFEVLTYLALIKKNSSSIIHILYY